MKSIKQIIIILALTIIMCSITAFAKSPEITGTAAVRTQEPVGIRIKAEIDIATANADTTSEYGFIVARKVFLTGNGLENHDLTFDSNVYYSKGISMGVVDGEHVDRFFEKNDTDVCFAGYIHGITPYFYSDILVARPYVITYDGTFYGEPVEVSLYNAAKDTKNDSGIYDSLSPEQKDVIDSIIVAVEGEPYELNSDDFRIVLSTTVIKNINPTYSVNYDLFNPYTGEIECGVAGRKKSRDRDEIESMLLSPGKVVPVYDGVVQDTADGYVVCDYASDGQMWVLECDVENGNICFVGTYDTPKCKDCINEYVNSAKKITASVCADTPVFIFDGDFENAAFSLSDIDKLSSKDLSLLCYNTVGDKTVYSDYVRGHALIYGGECKYIIAVVKDDENSALDEKCKNHTYFNVCFYVDGAVVGTFAVKYGESLDGEQIPTIDDGRRIYGWSLNDDNNAEKVVDVTELVIEEDTYLYPVFIKNPNSEEFMEKLTRGYTQLCAIKRFPDTELSKQAITIIKECMGYVLDDANNGHYIDEDYLRREYGDMVESVRVIIKEQMTKTQRSNFVNFLTNTRNVDKDVQDFLIDYFDIDLSEV